VVTATAAAGPLVQPVLDHAHPSQRNVAHLPHDHPGRLGAVEAGATATAGARFVVDHIVRIRHQRQAGARRPRLLTRLATGCLAALTFRLGKPIRRRRQRGIARVLSQPPSQLLHLRGQLSDPVVLLLDHLRLGHHHGQQLLA
jgi:hypothetical protein